MNSTKRKLLKSAVMISIICWTSIGNAQSEPADKDVKRFDKDLDPRPLPPEPPPKCQGNLQYFWLNAGDKSPIKGILFTEDASDCLINKYTWCVKMWNLSVDKGKKECENEKQLLFETANAEIKQCDKLKNSCFADLEDKSKWYKNPWFAAGVGFAVGVIGATTITILVMK